MDTVKFSGDLYNTNLIVKYDVESSVGRNRFRVIEDIDPRFYHLFLLFLKQYPVKKISSKKLIKDLGELLNVHHQIRTIIFQGQKFKGEKEHVNQLPGKSFVKKAILQDHEDACEQLKNILLVQCSPHWILKQYNILKRLINQCSIPNKIRKNAGEFLSNIKIVEEDPIFSRQLTRKKSEITNNLDFPFAAFTDTIFYINEFLDMMKERQEKAIFREMIYSNNFEDSKIHLFTKAGYYKNKRLMKYSDQINLGLLRLQHDVLVPTREQLQCIRVRRNYECLNQK